MSATLTRLQPAPASSSSRPSTPAASRRDPWFDNAKMLLVTLVVVGHSWTLLPHTFTTLWAYDFLYLWHVPAFVLVTGYLSRSFRFTRRHLSKLLTTVVVPYVVFEYALTTFRTLGGEHHGPLFLNPHWPMWYLSVLFLWRLATPVLQRVPHPLALSVAVSVVGGFSTGDTLDVARAMGLLPFFVMGLLATPERLERLRRPSARLVALAAFGLALAAATVLASHLDKEWLYWRSSYGQLHASPVAGMLTRLVLIGASGGLAVAFLALVPRRGGWFARMGSASLVVYLCHGFVVKTVQYSAIPGWAGHHADLALALFTVGAVSLALLLAAPPVSRRLNVLVDPVGSAQRWWRGPAGRDSRAGASPDARRAAASSAGRLPVRATAAPEVDATLSAWASGTTRGAWRPR